MKIEFVIPDDSPLAYVLATAEKTGVSAAEVLGAWLVTQVSASSILTELRESAMVKVNDAKRAVVKASVKDKAVARAALEVVLVEIDVVK